MMLTSEKHFIPSGDGRRLVIPDLHGCCKTLKALLHTLQLTKNDQLFFLGDYIDRGPDSYGVLECVIRLQQEGFQVYPLRGNHEEMFLHGIQDDWDYQEMVDRILESLPKETPSLKKTAQQYQMVVDFREFMEQLPYFYELEDYFLVHAGFDFKANNPFDVNDKDSRDAMTWIRRMYINPEKTCGKPIIHGHTPTPLSEIKRQVEQRSLEICLDNGAFAQNAPEFGKLVCLELNSSRLFVQQRIDERI